MPLLDSLKGLFVRNATYRNPPDWFYTSLVGGNVSDSGETVNQKTALTLAWVWQAVSTISNDIGRLPCNLYETTPEDERIKAVRHPAYRLARKRPNPFMSSKTFRSVLTKNALLTGNGLAWIERDGRGAPLEMYPLQTDNVRIHIVENEPVYLVRFRDNDQAVPISYRDIFHIKNVTSNGYWGLDVVSYARNSIGLGLATEKHGNRFFKNNAKPSVVLESEQNINKETADQLLASWNAAHAGAGNAYKTAILSGGMSAKVMSIANDNAQWLQSRQFQRQEIASWFLLPANKLNDTASVSYSSVEAYNKSYLDQTLMNWLITWEEEYNDKLLTPRQRENENYYFEFNTAGLLRADLLQRYQAYQVGISSEFLSPNEVRRFENLPRRVDDGGDNYQNPNTKSGSTPQQTNQTTPTIEEETQLADSLRLLLNDRLERMVRLEIKKANAAAGKDHNFVGWLEAFYGTFRDQLYESLSPCYKTTQAAGFSNYQDLDDVVDDYISDSVERLLTVAGDSIPSELIKNVEQETHDWLKRIQLVINQIMEIQDA
jgi:HK97 family phage portal protein